MLTRRIISSKPRRSFWPEKAEIGSRIKTGITRSLQIMVLKATVSTITMPVAADMPPRYTNSASSWCLSAIGSISTNQSAFDASEKCSIPANATGNTKILMASR